jgi:hypothetical protein
MWKIIDICIWFIDFLSKVLSPAARERHQPYILSNGWTFQKEKKNFHDMWKIIDICIWFIDFLSKVLSAAARERYVYSMYVYRASELIFSFTGRIMKEQ